MTKIENKLFFWLLQRWVKDKYYKVESRNGCLCLLPSSKYNVIIKSSMLMRNTNE